MKIFTSKNFIQKLIISIICVVTFLNFCMSTTVRAETDFGGTMMTYMREFVTAIADVSATLVQFGVTGRWSYAVDNEGSGSGSGDYWVKSDKFRYPKLQVSPELIFANKIEMLDVNFISPIDRNKYSVKLEDDGPLMTLRTIIASWYVTLRTIAVVGLLSVLIYIGIRIIISSTASDKAKYKQRLLDWVIAFCLLFFMHYIMAATVTVVNRANDMLSEVANVNAGLSLPKGAPFGKGEVHYTGRCIYKTTDFCRNYVRY